jgi:hypothetical protein
VKRSHWVPAGYEIENLQVELGDNPTPVEARLVAVSADLDTCLIFYASTCTVTSDIAFTPTAADPVATPEPNEATIYSWIKTRREDAPQGETPPG